MLKSDLNDSGQCRHAFSPRVSPCLTGHRANCSQSGLRGSPRKNLKRGDSVFGIKGERRSHLHGQGDDIP